jgi:hypothetical protein
MRREGGNQHTILQWMWMLSTLTRLIRYRLCKDYKKCKGEDMLRVITVLKFLGDFIPLFAMKKLQV